METVRPPLLVCTTSISEPWKTAFSGVPELDEFDTACGRAASEESSTVRKKKNLTGNVTALPPGEHDVAEMHISQGSGKHTDVLRP
jgi:hypothetical protein